MAVYKIIVNDQEFTANEGVILSDFLSDIGEHTQTPCGGKGICEKCKVSILGTFIDADSKSLLTYSEPAERLSCKTIISGNLIVKFKYTYNYTYFHTYNYIYKNIGIAIDIGTTTLEAAVIELDTKEICFAPKRLNPQRRYGTDCISRISSGENPEIAESMSLLIQKYITSLISQILDDLSLDTTSLKIITISGNTLMAALFCKEDFLSMGTYPYKVTDFSYENRFLPEYPNTKLQIVPHCSAFIGGDIVGAITILSSKLNSNYLFIDLGTNGEIIIFYENKLYGTSCAMGPALEGMNISCGVTDSLGAVNHIEYHENKLILTVNGNAEPIGLTGSAVIDIIAILLKNSILNNDGSFNYDLTNQTDNALKEYLHEGKFHITENIYFSQHDVRAIQLAKGACLSAIKILLEHSKADIDKIEKVFIAGSLGENLNLDNFKFLGFIPQFENANFEVIGNTSLKSALEFCENSSAFEKTKLISKAIETISVSDFEEYNDLFLECLGFK